jgi:undecaprenyl-diphosphatase|tara:strand:+ start:254 stop:1066 length:813 start_codon:yes stop_codon:yes gene_type:complete
MDLLQTIIISIIQGMIEWLPISSQGNIIILMSEVFDYNIENALKLSIILHLGTVMSASIYFRKEIIQITTNLKNYKIGYNNEINSLTTFVILSTISSSIIGLILFSSLLEIAENVFFTAIIGAGLIITGILQKTIKSDLRNTKNLSHDISIITGILQGFAVIPGISRSGITTSYLLVRKFNPSTALRLSFIMSIPAVLLANLYVLLFEGIQDLQYIELIIAIMFSCISGLISISSFIKIAQKIKFWIFSIIIGTLILIPYLFEIISQNII